MVCRKGFKNYIVIIFATYCNFLRSVLVRRSIVNATSNLESSVLTNWSLPIAITWEAYVRINHIFSETRKFWLALKKRRTRWFKASCLLVLVKWQASDLSEMVSLLKKLNVEVLLYVSRCDAKKARKMNFPKIENFPKPFMVWRILPYLVLHFKI